MIKQLWVKACTDLTWFFDTVLILLFWGAGVFFVTWKGWVFGLPWYTASVIQWRVALTRLIAEKHWLEVCELSRDNLTLESERDSLKMQLENEQIKRKQTVSALKTENSEWHEKYHDLLATRTTEIIKELQYKAEIGDL